MSKLKINTDYYEINKPSELCQIIYYENYKKGIFANLNAIQLDLINSLMYLAKKKILEDTKGDTKEEYQRDIITLEIPVLDITTLLNKYENHAYDNILNQLYCLKKIDVMVNTLGKVKDEISYTLTSFIHTISWTKHKESISKKIKVGLDGEIVRSLIDRKKFFSKMFLTINYSMKSKYSKLLYELLKDYEGISQITIEYNNLITLLNVDQKNDNLVKWLYFRPNILEKSINEINEKSDIKIAYETIKEKPSKKERLQVTKIKFNIEKQTESRLKELGIIQPSITESKFYIKSKNKMDTLIKNGYNIIDSERWIEIDIQQNQERYDAELRLDGWIKATTSEDKKLILEALARYLDCSDPTVYIDSDYVVKSVFGKDALTKNSIDTLTKLNEILKAFEEENKM